MMLTFILLYRWELGSPMSQSMNQQIFAKPVCCSFSSSWYFTQSMDCVPQERPNSWPSSLPPPPRTAHGLTCPQCQPRHAGQAGLPALPWGEEGQTRGLAKPRGQPWPRCPIVPQSTAQNHGAWPGAGPRPHVDEDRPAPGEHPCPCRPAPRPGVSQDATLALDTHWLQGPRSSPGHREETEAQRPPGALRDESQAVGKKTQKRRAISLARGGLPAAPLRNTGPSEAAEQGRGIIQ